ncbi:hypothetical protein DTO164E3_5594 [Paecilomyces variotii]|nr:hypothetical protein DTO164E3_5594 [Paecilomyces variotii]KAJ9198314.1 hypothetical protein DTO032I3_5553 [Paecilomyces variotii]KAJ9279284.1 hypothetical protein DTO021D3_3740 [Paecilomyces variotii]KAJ9344715.1 hypothetical protein DTO027B6_2897 [Paecilomyces variotii]KAJ9350627.1 hypothetical protein DTO027B9_6820 [Paecilomyces variotii]
MPDRSVPGDNKLSLTSYPPTPKAELNLQSRLINISIPFDHLPFPPPRDAFPLVAPRKQFEGSEHLPTTSPVALEDTS